MGALLAAAALGIWMENMHFHPTPRINPFTIALGIFPVPALAWAVFLWTRTRPKGALDIVFRIVVSGLLFLATYYCVLMAIFAATFVG